MAKKRARPKAKQKVNKVWVFVAAVIVIAAVVLYMMPMAGTNPYIPAGTNPYIPAGQGQNYREESLGESCTLNTQCFLASCKSNPGIVKCVNSTAQEVYYVNCNGANSGVDASITQNFSQCSCVQGTCKMVG